MLCKNIYAYAYIYIYTVKLCRLYKVVFFPPSEVQKYWFNDNTIIFIPVGHNLPMQREWCTHRQDCCVSISCNTAIYYINVDVKSASSTRDITNYVVKRIGFYILSVLIGKKFIRRNQEKYVLSTIIVKMMVVDFQCRSCALVRYLPIVKFTKMYYQM